MRKQKLYQAIASTLSAIRNCDASVSSIEDESERDHWTDMALVHRARLRDCEAALPSGSGFDDGTRVDEDESTDACIVLRGSFHHMSGDGYYIGWTDHVVRITPTFHGIDVAVETESLEDDHASDCDGADGCSEDCLTFDSDDHADYVAEIMYDALIRPRDDGDDGAFERRMNAIGK